MKNEMTHYYLECIFCNALQSKVQKAFYEYLKLQEKKLIPISDFEAVKNKILDKASEINKEFPRCKPLKISFDSSFANSNNIRIYGLDGMNYQFKGCFLTNPETF